MLGSERDMDEFAQAVAKVKANLSELLK